MMIPGFIEEGKSGWKGLKEDKSICFLNEI